MWNSCEKESFVSGKTEICLRKSLMLLPRWQPLVRLLVKSSVVSVIHIFRLFSLAPLWRIELAKLKRENQRLF
jgi:hypothetical protein